MLNNIENFIGRSNAQNSDAGRMEILSTGPQQLSTAGAQAAAISSSQQQTTFQRPMTNQEKMTAVFAYIKQHLDGNEQAIWELGEACRQYGEQAQNEQRHVQFQLDQAEQNLGKVVGDARDVFAQMQWQIDQLSNNYIVVKNEVTAMQAQLLDIQEHQKKFSARQNRQSSDGNFQKEQQKKRDSQAQQKQGAAPTNQIQKSRSEPLVNFNQQLLGQQKLVELANKNVERHINLLSEQLRSQQRPPLQPEALQKNDIPQKKKRQPKKKCDQEKKRGENQQPRKGSASGQNGPKMKQPKIDEALKKQQGSPDKKAASQQQKKKVEFEVPPQKKKQLTTKNQPHRPKSLQFIYVKKTAVDSEPCSVVDVEGDGNCFYRAVAVAMGLGEAAYRHIKKLVHDFTIANRDVLENVGDIEATAARILQEGQAAQNEDLYLTAQCLDRDIRLYQGEFPNGMMTEIVNEFGPRQPTLRLLFVGRLEYGHFKALVPRPPVQQGQPVQQQPVQSQPAQRKAEQNKPAQSQPAAAVSATTSQPAHNPAQRLNTGAMEEETEEETRQIVQANLRRIEHFKKQKAAAAAAKKTSQKDAAPTQAPPNQQPPAGTQEVRYRCGCQPATHKGYTLSSYYQHVQSKHKGNVQPGSSHDKVGNPLCQQAQQRIN